MEEITSLILTGHIASLMDGSYDDGLMRDVSAHVHEGNLVIRLMDEDGNFQEFVYTPALD